MKKIIGLMQFLHIFCAWSMESTFTNKLSQQITDGDLRKLKGNLIDKEIKLSKTDNMYGYFRDSIKSHILEGNFEAKKKLLLQLTYYFKDFETIRYFNSENIINKLFSENQKEDKISFFNNLCAYTDYYYVENPDMSTNYDLHFHEYAQFFMNISDIKERTNYINKYKKLFLIGKNDEPHGTELFNDHEWISWFIKPRKFLTEVVDPIANNNNSIKECFLKMYLNHLISRKLLLQGYCYFFNNLFRYIFNQSSSIKSVIEYNRPTLSYSIVNNELKDDKDLLSLVLFDGYRETKENAIKHLLASAEHQKLIIAILSGVAPFEQVNNVVYNVRALLKTNVEALLFNVDSKNKKLIIENLYPDTIIEDLLKNKSNNDANINKIYKLALKGIDQQDMSFEQAVDGLKLNELENEQKKRAVYGLIKNLLNNTTILSDEKIAKINRAFLIKNIYSQQQKEFFVAFVKEQIPNVCSFWYKVNGQHNCLLFISDKNSSIYNKMTDEERNALFSCFGIPSTPYTFLLRSVTDDESSKTITSILSKLVPDQEKSVLEEMTICFNNYQKNTFVFGYSQFFNKLTKSHNVLKSLCRFQISDQLGYASVGNNRITRGYYLQDEYDFFSQDFTMKSFLIAIKDTNPNPYQKAWGILFTSDDQEDLQKKVLTELINRISNVAIKDPYSIAISSQSLNSYQANKDIVAVLNEVKKVCRNELRFQKIAEQVIKAKQLPIVFNSKARSFEIQLTEDEQFAQQYGRTKAEAIKDINNFLPTLLEKDTLDKQDTDFINEVVKDRAHELNDATFLALYNDNKVDQDTITKLKNNFLNHVKNAKKEFQYDFTNYKWVLVSNDFGFIYNKMTDSQKEILKQINCFDIPQTKDVNEAYNTIYTTIKNAQGFKKILEGLKKPLVDRSSKTVLIENYFDDILCKKFLDIFLEKLNAYLAKTFVFGIVNFIEYVCSEYFDNSQISNAAQELDFVSILAKSNGAILDQDVVSFIAAIQNPNKEYADLKKAFIDGLGLYVEYVKKNDQTFSIESEGDNNLIKKLCEFLQYDINKLNTFLKEVCKNNQNVAQVICNAYQKHENDLSIVLQLDNSKNYYQIINKPKIVVNKEQSKLPINNPRSEEKHRLTGPPQPFIQPNPLENTENVIQNVNENENNDPITQPNRDNADPKIPTSNPTGSSGGVWGVLSAIGNFFVSIGSILLGRLNKSTVHYFKQGLAQQKL